MASHYKSQLTRTVNTANTHQTAKSTTQIMCMGHTQTHKRLATEQCKTGLLGMHSLLAALWIPSLLWRHDDLCRLSNSLQYLRYFY